MNVKKVSVRLFAGVLLLFLLVLVYLFLTINRQPVIQEVEHSGENHYQLPNTIVSVEDESDKLQKQIEKEIEFTLNDVSRVDLQISALDNKTIKNKVVTFSSIDAQQLAQVQMDNNNQLNKISKNGITYYQVKKHPETFYIFPEENTLVVTEDATMIAAISEKRDENNIVEAQSNSVLTFNFSKDDPSIEHFIHNLPDQLVNRLEGINGQLDYNEKSTSFVEIKMENALFARTLAVVLPGVIQQLKAKILKVNGQFVVNGTNVTLTPQELESLAKSNHYTTIKSSKKSVYLILDGQEEKELLMEVLINVIIGR
ncbi:MAG: hypothetical protein R2730_09240 [Chitinophagales bacterium]